MMEPQAYIGQWYLIRREKEVLFPSLGARKRVVAACVIDKIGACVRLDCPDVHLNRGPWVTQSELITRFGGVFLGWGKRRWIGGFIRNLTGCYGMHFTFPKKNDNRRIHRRGK